MEALAAKADSEAGAERAAALAERLGAEIAAYAETVRREQEERASLERQLKSMQGKVGESTISVLIYLEFMPMSSHFFKALLGTCYVPKLLEEYHGMFHYSHPLNSFTPPVIRVNIQGLKNRTMRVSHV